MISFSIFLSAIDKYWQHLDNKSWQHRDSNLGLLGAKEARRLPLPLIPPNFSYFSRNISFFLVQTLPAWMVEFSYGLHVKVQKNKIVPSSGIKSNAMKIRRSNCSKDGKTRTSVLSLNKKIFSTADIGSTLAIARCHSNQHCVALPACDTCGQ